MRTIETQVFNFDELNDKAKEKARQWYYNASQHDEWWESTYEDAETIGLKITGFDVGRGCYAEGRFLTSARECAQSIVDNHGEHCETYKTASAFLKERDAIVDTAERDENGEFRDESELDGKLDDCEAEFLKSILEDYRIILTKELEYIGSAEYIDEQIRANEYTFTADGERFG